MMEASLTKLKFVADGMLGSSSRWLRMLGCNVKYCNDMPDDALLKIAEQEERVLLTRDSELFRRASAGGLRAAFVEGGSEAERLASIARRFSIRLEVDMAVTRCPVCDSPLRSVGREAVLDKVAAGTLRHYREFWVCEGCGKVYWRGGHWAKITEILNKAKELMGKEG